MLAWVRCRQALALGLSGDLSSIDDNDANVVALDRRRNFWAVGATNSTIILGLSTIPASQGLGCRGARSRAAPFLRSSSKVRDLPMASRRSGAEFCTGVELK
jgi:hypothetical protein